MPVGQFNTLYTKSKRFSAALKSAIDGLSGWKKLKEWDVSPDRIKEVADEENCASADLLSVADFKKYVLENEAVVVKKNSQFIIMNNKLEKPY